MRHTLLPTTEKKALRLEYRTRLLIVLSFGLSIAFLIGIIALIPAFLRISTERQTVQASALRQAHGTSTDPVVGENLAVGESLLAKIQEGTPSVHSSDILRDVIAVRGSVSIRSFSVSVTQSSVETVIQGTAPTRDALLSFKTRLESQYPGTKVDLPVSTLVAAKNVQYSMRITQAIQ